MLARQRTVIRSPINDVWRIVSDPEATPRFLSWVTRWSPAGGPPRGPAARYDVRMRVGAVELGGIIEIVEWSPPHTVGWKSITGIRQHGRIHLRERAGSNTEATMELSYVAPGPLGGLALIALPLMLAQVRGSLRKLRAIAETSRPRIT